MTRLEKQINEQENKLQELKSFAAEKMEIFESQFEFIKSCLKKYKVKEFNTDNCFVDYPRIGSDPIFRMYLGCDLSNLTALQKKNLEKKLREVTPMPICPVSNNHIHFCYHD